MGREGAQKEYSVYAFDNGDNSGRPLIGHLNMFSNTLMSNMVRKCLQKGHCAISEVKVETLVIAKQNGVVISLLLKRRQELSGDLWDKYK